MKYDISDVIFLKYIINIGTVLAIIPVKFQESKFKYIYSVISGTVHIFLAVAYCVAAPSKDYSERTSSYILNLLSLSAMIMFTVHSFLNCLQNQNIWIDLLKNIDKIDCLLTNSTMNVKHIAFKSIIVKLLYYHAPFLAQIYVVYCLCIFQPFGWVIILSFLCIKRYQFTLLHYRILVMLKTRCVYFDYYLEKSFLCALEDTNTLHAKVTNTKTIIELIHKNIEHVNNMFGYQLLDIFIAAFTEVINIYNSSILLAQYFSTNPTLVVFIIMGILYTCLIPVSIIVFI